MVRRYRQKALWFFLVLVLCTILATERSMPDQMGEIISSNNCGKIEISKLAFLEWNNPLKLELIEREPPPPNAAQFTGIPGPKYYPVRPYLETFVSSGYLASTFVRGDNQTMPVAILVGDTTRVMPLPNREIDLLSFSPRSDGGVWALYRDLLIHYDRNGVKKHALDAPGTGLVGVAGDAVWVMSLDQAWFVNANGDIKGPYTWEGFLDSGPYRQSLCKLDPNKPGGIQCLEPDGKDLFISLSWLEERAGVPLVFTPNKILTTDLGGQTLYYYSPEGTAELDLQNAGLTSEGEVFVSIRVDENWADLCLSNGTNRRLPIKYEKPFVPLPLTLFVVAVEGERTLISGFDRAIWYKGTRIDNRFVVDDKSYRHDVFPHAWYINPVRFANAHPDGTVILSASGPTGMVIIGLRWTPFP